MFVRRLKSEWWFKPVLETDRIRIPEKLRKIDPVSNYDVHRFRGPSRVGAFKHSRLWVRYNRLQALNAGYVVPLYDLGSIGKRFGLSEAGQRYFRKYILPEPFDIVRRRSVQAHHWSRFTLMVLDVVLLDLQSRGINQFLNRFEDHIELVQRGVEYLQSHYENKAQSLVSDMSDKFGVQWLE